MYSHPLVSTACAALRQSGSEAQVVRIVAILGNDRDAMAIAEDGHIELGAALGVMPGINLEKALVLADAIEDQELATKMPLRKRPGERPTS
jgi:hypothetical protein